MILIEYFLKFGFNLLDYSDLLFIGGNNGPYHDPETPVRIKGHSLITFSKCFELTNEKIYFKKAKKLAQYLISDKARTHGHSFHHRFKDGKDQCNGLIGQAWTFEALACATSFLDNPKYSVAAEEVFFQHKFNSKFGLWYRLDIDGEILSIDSTFNHQLWFAACAMLLITPKKDEIRERVYRFMECLPQNLSFLDNGLIYHPIERNINQRQYSLQSIFTFLSKQKNLWNQNNKEYRKKMIHKSVGYHQFNMYAFGMLKESLPDHPFWQSTRFKQSVNFLLSDEFKYGILDNVYGFPYNPPGFEVPCALSMLTDISDEELVEISSWWVNEQFRRCYNSETEMMDRNTEDPMTHTARVYELTRLPTSLLKKIKVNINSIR